MVKLIVNSYKIFNKNNSTSSASKMTLPSSTRRLFAILTICTLFINPIDSAGHIDLQIEELILRKAPVGCCQNGSDCAATHSNSSSACSLDFRLCIGISEFLQSGAAILQSRKDCLIGAANFSIRLENLAPDETDNGNSTGARPFVVRGFPLQRLNFTSIGIDSPNIFIELSILNGADGKLLLFSRPQQTIRLNPGPNGAPILLQYLLYGNSLVYRLQVRCSPGFSGPKCAVFCEPPQPSDHYICTEEGARCLPGWTGIRCSHPICVLSCQNGGRCIGPNKCACPTGWEGSECEKCKPRAGCQHGYCKDEPGKCFCHSNWTGPDCNLVVNKCLERPCKNGGLCTTYGRHGDYFYCICPPGFTGVDCAISYAICKNASCGPNQRCAPLQNSYSCVCDPGWEGPECQQRKAQQRIIYDKIVLPNTPPTTQQAKNISSINTMVSVHPTNLPSQQQNGQQFGEEFGVVKALICACFLLLLLIIAILCCGQSHQNPCAAIPTKFIGRSKPIRDEMPEFGGGGDSPEEEGDALPMTMANGGRDMKNGPLARKLRPFVRWSGSTTDDDELDSGMGSIHSTHTPIGPNDSETQHTRRLVIHPWTAMGQQMSSAATSQSPPPPYEDTVVWTLNAGATITNHRNLDPLFNNSRARGEAFV